MSYFQVKDSSVLSEERVQGILHAVRGMDPEEGISSTMVFVNTAQTAQSLVELLRSKGLECAEFHKLIEDEVKAESLSRFREGNVKVLVCTDAASRGLDLPNVKHVIQAEFALNVVQHLHRIGRASRAGNAGYATNFYDDSSKLLIQAILPKTKESRTVQQAFSRRRGLRQKDKKQIKRGGSITQ